MPGSPGWLRTDAGRTWRIVDYAQGVDGTLDWGPLLGLGLKLSWWRSFVVCTRVAQEGPLTGRADAAVVDAAADMPSRPTRGNLVLQT